MATPFFATEYTMDHLGLPADLRGRLTLNYYPSGHMMYLQDESRVALHDNIARFVDRAVKR
jgi:carboxypeptidase C (cathepsin A)